MLPLPPAEDADLTPSLTSLPTFEEMTDAGDGPRGSWAPVWAYLNNLSKAQLADAHDQVQAELAEQEITGSVFDAEDGTERLWQLDSVPFVLDPGEWQLLGNGLAQRAQVLEAILQDLHGPRQLLAQDWFPAQLLFEHPGYLRPAIGAGQARFLHCYAADLVRGADGDWRVLADRCQAPFGLGYALQNRLVIGRSLTDLFQQTQVQALAPFFGNLVEYLRRRSGHADSRVVLFGTRNPTDTNYEQAFLSRYLDIDFVTADDLTVRDRRLWLKTMGGLTPIDVMLRFVHDRWSDPLNFSPDSTAGVPGLIDAVRAGNLVVANGLGSGVVDSPGLLGLVPRCAEHFGLAVPPLQTVASRWCGDHLDRARLTTQLRQQVLLSTWYGLRQLPLFIDRHTPAAQAEELVERVLAEPAAYTAVERVRPSIAPAWTDGVLNQHAIVLRLFLVADEAGGWRTLPGGLVRSAVDPAFAYAGIRHGGTSKDVWVPTVGDQQPAGIPVEMLHRGFTARSALDLPSSRLDDLFWFGRTAESIDHLARLLRVAVAIERQRSLGEREAGAAALDHLCDLYAMHDPDAKPRGPKRRLVDLVTAKPPATSLQGQLQELARLARTTRAYISGDAWLLVQDLRRQMNLITVRSNTRLGSLNGLAVRVLGIGDAITGTLLDHMMRDQAWTFVELGRRLQRAAMLAEMLTACARHRPSAGDLLALMEVAASAVTWRSRYGRPPDLDGLHELVAVHPENPRSISFQFDRLGALLHGLPGLDSIGDPIPDLLETARAALYSRRTDRIPALMRELSDSIDHRWFSHALVGRSVDRSQEVN